MKITKVPHKFMTGETLSPRNLNDNLTHLRDQIKEVQKKRYCHFSVLVPWESLDETSSEYVRSYMTQFPTDVIVDRAYLRVLGHGTGAIRAKMVGPWGLMNEVVGEVTVENGESWQESHKPLGMFLRSEDPIVISIEGTSSSWDVKRAYLELHLRSDRYNTAGAYLLSPYIPRLLDSSDTNVPSLLNTEFTNIQTSVEGMGEAKSFTRSELYTVTGLTTGTAEQFRTFTIPRVPNRNITHCWVGAGLPSSSSGGEVFSVGIYEGPVGKIVESLSIDNGSAVGVSGRIPFPLDISGSSLDPEYTLKFFKSSGSGGPALVYIWLFYS